MSYTDVTVEVKNGIGRITINRPESLNSLRIETYTDLRRALIAMDDDPNVVVTVLQGKGRFFSSGADVRSSMPSNPDSAKDYEETIARFASGPGATARALIDHSKLLVVLLNGPVVGWPAGVRFQFIASTAVAIANADLIYAAESAYVYAPFTALAVSAEGGASAAYVQRMGVGAASEALLLGRRFTAKELVPLGFVNRTFPDATFVQETERILADAVENLSPNSLKVTKQLIRESLRPAAHLANAKELEVLTERALSGEPTIQFAKQTRLMAAKKPAAKSNL
ncbi:hypothetical protein SeMB42_g06391 [Synchytrium endobioticum]|uniref:Uncharacterized protein n=1 Tax=Synchytrium endobioticum TaxID=286115 RepID=A0A507CLV4_9FUNG|nr:hypothetical protein SeMB42_g06391 [Synchytrium endobioticum]TPX50835.1 hypothetical protein SeLEV6574_g00648 [Synchytrium endobioticum]